MKAALLYFGVEAIDEARRQYPKIGSSCVEEARKLKKAKVKSEQREAA
jgi:hypothetical protein